MCGPGSDRVVRCHHHGAVIEVVHPGGEWQPRVRAAMPIGSRALDSGEVDARLRYVVLFGDAYWSEVINLDAMAKHGMIDPQDTALVYRTDSVDEAYAWLVPRLLEHALGRPGAGL